MKIRIGYNPYVKQFVAGTDGILIVTRHFMFATGRWAWSI